MGDCIGAVCPDGTDGTGGAGGAGASASHACFFFSVAKGEETTD